MSYRRIISYLVFVVILWPNLGFASNPHEGEKTILCPGTMEAVFVKPELYDPNDNKIKQIEWSDAYISNGGYRGNPIIGRCGQGPFFWVFEAKDPYDPAFLHEVPPQYLEQWKNPPTLMFPDESEYLQALAQGLATTRKREIFLRLHAWWLANDSVRDAVINPETPFKEGSAARRNLEILTTLLDNSQPDQLLLKVEALRELGSFQEATALLEKKLPADYRSMQGKLKKWIKEKSVFVKKINGSSYRNSISFYFIWKND